MKNVLNYYYNLNPTSIHQVNKNYRCYINNEEYFLTLYVENQKNKLDQIYELSNYLLQNQIPCHQIIINNYNQIITLINNEPYILLKIFIKNRTVNVEDVLLFSNININTDNDRFNLLVKNNWYKLWANKIDYIEYQISQFGKKYPIIRESVNYYIGLAENAVELLGIIEKKFDESTVVSHKRINSNNGTIDFYNPLNFILDNKIRDMCEFIKECFFSSNYSLDDIKLAIYRLNLNDKQYVLLFLRLLFPTYYFDYYEKIIFGKKNESELIKIIDKNQKYLEFLHDIYLYFKNFSNLPEIDWLIKK